MRSTITASTLFLSACTMFSEAPTSVTPQLVAQDSGSRASLRGISAVDAQVCWASGSSGTVLRTTDGGRSWHQLEVPDAEGLDFRDIQAFDRDRAVLMTAGQPARIYRTEDGGKTWDLGIEHPSAEAFFDGMAFWDEHRGLAFSDPVEGRFLVLATDDGGRSWRELGDALPSPEPGEAGFAASGTNVAVSGDGSAWIGTGGSTARILRSEDGGRSWQAVPTSMRSGASSQGVFSVAFRDDRIGVAVGGDYTDPSNPMNTALRSEDGGVSWQAAERGTRGYRSCVSPWWGRGPNLWVAVGRGGCDFSDDDGATWNALSDEGYYALDIAPDGSAWVAGAEGRIARLVDGL